MTEPKIQPENKSHVQESLPEEPEITEERWEGVETRILEGGLTDEDVEFMCDYFEDFMEDLDR